MSPEILTVSGHYFNLLEPRLDDIRVIDIAHALGNCARFAGHSRAFYSVAQHSVLVSQIVPPEHALQALLHDAAEAYVGDMTSPLKRLVPVFGRIEQRIWNVISRKFNVPATLSDEVRRADLVLLATERRDLMNEQQARWGILDGITPMATVIKPWAPAEAMFKWACRFEEIERGVA